MLKIKNHFHTEKFGHSLTDQLVLLLVEMCKIFLLNRKFHFSSQLTVITLSGTDQFPSIPFV